MNKKIIAFLLTVFYVMSAFGVSVSADASAQSNNISDSLSLINAINPEYTLPEEAQYFTRIEFVKLLIDVMQPQFAAEVDTGYDDVDWDHPYASSLVFAKKLDIVSPAVSFYPDDNVTYTQAVKMAVTAAGYKPLADAKGAYPTGYLTIASDLELDEGLSANDAPLTIADGLRLICNLFDVNVFVQTGFGETPEYENVDGVTFLYQYHRISTVYGIVNANEYSSLTSYDNPLADDCIKIGTADYKSAGDFANLLGYKVKAYINEDKELVYASKYESNEIMLTSSQVDRADGFDVVTFDGTKEHKYTLDDSFKYIKNGKYSSITSVDFTPYFKFDTGSVVLIDNNEDNKFDVVLATEYTYSLVSKVSTYEGIIYDVNSAGASINLGGEIEYFITSVEDGETINLELKQLTSGMLIAYTVSDDGKLYNIRVCDNIIDGKITALDTTNDLIYINDVGYKSAYYYDTYYSHLGLGTEASFYLGIDGKLAAVSASGEDYMKYGWFVGFSTPSGLDSLMLKIFSQTGEMQILTLPAKVTIDNVSRTSSYTKTFLEGLDDTHRLIKYSSNSDNELKKVDTFVNAVNDEFEQSGKNPTDSLTKFATGNYRFKSGSNLFISTTVGTFSYHIEATTFNFIIPASLSERNDDSKYGVLSTSYFETDQTYSGISVFDVDKYGCSRATLMFGSKRSSAGVNNYTGSAIIEKVTQGLDPNGEDALVVYAWKGNRYDVYYSDPELSYDYISILNPGDIVRFVADDDNVITGITRDFNTKTFEMASGYSNVAGILEYVMGMVYSSSDKYMNILTNPQITPTGASMPASYTLDDIRNVNIPNSPVLYVDLIKLSDGTVVSALPRMSEAADIKSYLDSGEDAHFIISRQYMLGIQLTVIYNIEVK